MFEELGLNTESALDKFNRRMPDDKHPGLGVRGDIIASPNGPRMSNTTRFYTGGIENLNNVVQADLTLATPEQAVRARNLAVRAVLGRDGSPSEVPPKDGGRLAIAHVRALEAILREDATKAAQAPPTAIPGFIPPGYGEPAGYPPPQAAYPPPQAAYPPAWPPAGPPPFAGPAPQAGPPAYPGPAPPAPPPSVGGPPQAGFAPPPPSQVAPEPTLRMVVWVKGVRVPVRFHGMDVQFDAAGAPLAYYLQWDVRHPDEPYPLDKIEEPFHLEFPEQPGRHHPVESPSLACRCGTTAILILLAYNPGV